MKTKTIFKTLAAAMLMPTMLLTTACSNNDDEIVNTENLANAKGYTLPVTVNVTRQGDDATTRATYTYDEDTKKGTLSFSTGDKLFVSGSYNEGNSIFAGMLDYVSDGKFSGTIMTQTEWTGTTEELLSADGGANATLLPAGYGEYGYLSIADEGTDEAHLSENPNKAFATSKATAVEQFSWEDDNDYSSGFELTPANAILNFTITGLAASTEVDVSFSYPNYPEDIVVSGKVTTDGDGTATFAIGIIYGNNLKDCTLTVDGNAITLPADKMVEAGHIYNISRSVAPAPAYTMAANAVAGTDEGKLICTDGHIHAYNADAGCTKSRVAKIIYVGSSTGDATYTHGLALALADESTSSMAWAAANTACSDKNTSAAVASASWMLPSKDQWSNMISAAGSYTNLRDGFNGVGGSNLESRYYWSSTENEALPARAWMFYFSDGRWYQDAKVKNNRSLVRACLAF